MILRPTAPSRISAGRPAVLLIYPIRVSIVTPLRVCDESCIASRTPRQLTMSLEPTADDAFRSASRFTSLAGCGSVWGCHAFRYIQIMVDEVQSNRRHLPGSIGLLPRGHQDALWRAGRSRRHVAKVSDAIGLEIRRAGVSLRTEEHGLACADLLRDSRRHC